MEEPQKFKVVLIGDGGVGKSTYIKKLCTGIFEKQYVATLGVEIHPIDIPRDEPARDLIFDVWDTAGQEKLGLLRESYYEGAHLGIIMFDLTSRITYKNVATWYRSLVHVCGEIPIVLIGNKADRNEIKCPSHMITFYRGRPNMAYFETSVKNNYNLNEPIMWLIEQIELGKVSPLQYSAHKSEEGTNRKDDRIPRHSEPHSLPSHVATPYEQRNIVSPPPPVHNDAIRAFAMTAAASIQQNDNTVQPPQYN